MLAAWFEILRQTLAPSLPSQIQELKHTLLQASECDGNDKAEVKDLKECSTSEVKKRKISPPSSTSSMLPKEKRGRSPNWTEQECAILEDAMQGWNMCSVKDKKYWEAITDIYNRKIKGYNKENSNSFALPLRQQEGIISRCYYSKKKVKVLSN